MRTRFLKTSGLARLRNISSAARLICSGNLVAFPTETVYGLGANVYNVQAVRKIFRVKGRPQDNPLIVHVWSLEQMWMLTDSIPMMFWVLAKHCMPGPLTVVVRKSERVPRIVTAGLPTVAIRMPDHAVARALLRQANVPIVAPSANISGRPSPTTAMHVKQDLNGKIAAILDGGACKIGVESTVLDITKNVPVILRPGGVTREDLEEVLHLNVKVARSSRRRPASPGMKYTHYAPKAEVVVFEGEKTATLLSMKKSAEQLSLQGMQVGIMAEASACGSFQTSKFYSLGTTGAIGAAQELFNGFRALDAQKVDIILCQGFVDEAMGTALMNRLRKAASRRVRV